MTIQTVEYSSKAILDRLDLIFNELLELRRVVEELRKTEEQTELKIRSK